MSHEVVSDLPVIEARRMRLEIRRRALAENRVCVSLHAREQAEERGIAPAMILEILQEGFLGRRICRLGDGRLALRLSIPVAFERCCAVVATLHGEHTVEVVTVLWQKWLT